MEKIVFFDGNSILNRAYYAIPPLNDRDGVNVNAVLGFLNIFLKTLEEEKPTGVVVAFDKRGKNFRKQLYEGYKATRKGMPDDLAAQMPILKNILSLMHVKYVEKEGVEADDIIGTLSARFGVSSVIFTGDKDLLQLIDDNTTGSERGCPYGRGDDKGGNGCFARSDSRLQSVVRRRLRQYTGSSGHRAKKCGRSVAGIRRYRQPV